MPNSNRQSVLLRERGYSKAALCEEDCAPATIAFPQVVSESHQAAADSTEPTVPLPRPLSRWQAMGKRGLDLVGSSLLLTVLFLPMLLIAVLVKCSSRGPILYAQERVGQDGKPFRLYKFRSMVDGAESATGPVWARSDDARQTRLGHWLRRWCIDELPQLFNVVRGEMSLVGPRPERPVFVERFSQSMPGYRLRHLVKPGLTGWAQVNGYYGPTSLARRLEHDLEYVARYSLLRDLWILLATPRRIYSGQGAAEPVDSTQEATVLAPARTTSPSTLTIHEQRKAA